MNVDIILTHVYYANTEVCTLMAKGSFPTASYKAYTDICDANLHLGTKEIVKAKSDIFFDTEQSDKINFEHNHRIAMGAKMLYEYRLDKEKA